MNVLLRGIQAVAVLAVLLAALALTRADGQPGAAPTDGVALAIVFDTSGSMKDPVPDGAGVMTAKYRIASRALEAITRRLEAFASGATSGQPRKIRASLITFRGNSAFESIPFGEFKAEAFRRWVKEYSGPAGNTPLGSAVRLGAKSVLGSGLTHKHILVVTDGENTVSPDPATVIPKLRQEALEKQTAVSFHFVAFDVDARVFEPLKKMGATVVGAADEKQLNTQIGLILERKILLEDEEPPAATGKKP